MNNNEIILRNAMAGREEIKDRTLFFGHTPKEKTHEHTRGVRGIRQKIFS